MSTDGRTAALEIPTARWTAGRGRLIAVGSAVVAVLCSALSLGHSNGLFRSSSPQFEIVEIDRGDVDLIVIEKGSLESSDGDVVRCRVESFQGLPVGAPPLNADHRPAALGPARTVRSAVVAVSGPKGPPIITTLKTKPAARHAGERGSSAASAAAAGIGVASKAARSASTAGLSAAEPTATVAAPDASAAAQRPVIRSFDREVEPHVPLRSTLPDQGAIATVAPPPPTILSIVPEGSQVKAGDVVCELDSSAFRDALQVQRLRCVQAQAWVEQAKYILEANEIAVREYEEGIFPQDLELVRRYIDIRQTEQARADRNLAWARAVYAKGYRTQTQLEADAAAFQQAQIALRDAEAMRERLANYTGKRIKKALRAKTEAIHADLLSLESCLQLENERRRRIEAMIANCTMRAPREGVVVYANRSSGWGRVELQIREGLTVYPSQPIFRLLDARHLQVKARINESQITCVRSGQPVLIHLEAYPDRVLKGSVAEIVPIPSLADGPFTDVRSFCANVRIKSGGFDELRPGLSAQVEFLVETRHEVTRVPLEAIRWVDDRSYAAVASSTADGPDWLWRSVALGATDTEFAEVKSGLAPGDRVIAHCESLPETDLGPPESEPKLDLAMGRR